MRRTLSTTLGATLLLQGGLACAESDVDAFRSTVTIQGEIGQHSSGANNRQNVNVGSASHSRTRSFNANVSTGDIRQTAQGSGIQQRINAGSMQNSQASTFSANVHTRSIEQVATQSGQRQEIDISSVTNSTVKGNASTSVTVGQGIKQVGSGEIVLGSVKNSTVGNFNQNLTIQGRLSGNNIRMGSVVGQQRYDMQGNHVGHENITEISEESMMPDFSQQKSLAGARKEAGNSPPPAQYFDTSFSGIELENTYDVYEERLRKNLCYDMFTKYLEGSASEAFSDDQCNQRIKSYIEGEEKYRKLVQKILNEASDPDNYKAVTQFLVDILPVTGTASSFYELITGKTAVSNEEASRALAVLGITLSILPGGKLGIKFIKGVYDARKIAKSASMIDNAASLRRSEYAITKAQQNYSDDFFSSLNSNQFKKSKISRDQLKVAGLIKADMNKIMGALSSFKKSEGLSYDIQLFIRKPNAKRANLIKEGAEEKPFALKNKTASDVDYYLNPGFNNISKQKFEKEILGTVLHYKPDLKTVIDDATEKIDGVRIKTKHYELSDKLKEAAKEFYTQQHSKNGKSLADIEKEFLDKSIARMEEFNSNTLSHNEAGNRIMVNIDKNKDEVQKFIVSDNGQVLTEKMKKITSDLDGFVFMDGNGKPVSEAVHKRLLEHLEGEKILQHGVVSKWMLSNYKEGVSRLGQILDFSREGGYLVNNHGLFDLTPR